MSELRRELYEYAQREHPEVYESLVDLERRLADHMEAAEALLRNRKHLLLHLADDLARHRTAQFVVERGAPGA